MDIVFSTFNARYSHTALALRCLRANLGELRDRSVIIEFDNRLLPQAAAEKLLACNPKLVLFSVYIWNLTLVTETAAILRAACPDLKIIIGGPEVSYEYEEQSLFQICDHLICGEGEIAAAELCRTLLGHPDACPPKVVHAQPVDLKTVTLPYDEYTDEDIAHRRIYIETSRGCPFLCDYCLSALEKNVRFIPASRMFPVFGKLIERGARIFKFLDRSFNVNAAHAAAILRYFLSNRRDGMMLHLEWEPGYIPSVLMDLIQNAPPEFLQLEVGVQTFNAEVARRINRLFRAEQIEQNIRRLAALPSVHLHADLIAGLPGESFESIAAGFDRLHACGPHEIQMGILKKLRGTPIARHDQEWQMVYNPAPPYNVVQTSALCFSELQKIRRFARFWDITVNNGRFPLTASLLWRNRGSVFESFMEWSEWVFENTQTTFGFSPQQLAHWMKTFLTGQRGLPEPLIQSCVEADLAARAPTFKGVERQARTKKA